MLVQGNAIAANNVGVICNEAPCACQLSLTTTATMLLNTITRLSIYDIAHVR